MVWPDMLVTMSPGLRRGTRRHVLARGIDADDVDLEPHLGHRAQRAEDRAGAAHVVLHLVHRVARLERDAAGVERDALADEHHRRFLRLAAVVGHDDQLRRFDRTVRDRQEGAHLESFHVLAVEHLDLELPVLRESAWPCRPDRSACRCSTADRPAVSSARCRSQSAHRHRHRLRSTLVAIGLVHRQDDLGQNLLVVVPSCS